MFWNIILYHRITNIFFWIIILYHEITNNVFEYYGEIMKYIIMVLNYYTIS